jgi:hypothetical protein
MAVNFGPKLGAVEDGLQVGTIYYTAYLLAAAQSSLFNDHWNPPYVTDRIAAAEAADLARLVVRPTVMV